MIDVGSAVGYLLLDSSGFKSGFQEAQGYLNTFQSKNATFQDKLKATGGLLTSVGSTLTTSVTLPLVGVGTALVKFSSDAETAFSGFQAKVGEVSGDLSEYREVMDDIYENNYGESFQDVADSMADVVNILGEMDPSNLQQTTESALALRDTFGYEVPESIRTVDTLMKNFGMTSEQAFDYIVKGQQEGLDYSGEFLDTLNEYSVQFGKLGFSADEMFNVLESGADSGAWNLDKVGDAIKEFSIRAMDGSDSSIAAFEAIGLNADEMFEKFAKGGDSAREAFDQTIQALKEVEDPVEQNIQGVALFGTMWEDLGPEVVFQLGNIKDGAVDAEGAMQDLKDVKYDNLGSAIESLGRKFISFGAELGNYIIPKVEKVISFIDGVAENFRGLDDGTKQLIVDIGLAVAAIGPVLLVAGKVVTLVSTINSLIAGAGGLSAILTALTGPIGVIIAATAALVLAWTTDFGGIQEKTAEIFEAIKEIFTGAWEFISGLWNDNFLGIQDTAAQAFQFLEDLFSGALNIIVDIFNVFAALFTGDWSGLWEAVKTLVSDIWNQVTGLFWDWLNLLVDTLIRIGVRLWEGAKQVFTDLKDGFVEMWDNIMDWFGRVVEDPVGTVKDIGSKLYEAGQDIFNSLWDGLSSIWIEIQDWVSDKVDWLVSKVKFWESESDKVSTSSFNGGQSGGGRRSVEGSYASGLDYVPRDMDVRVHRGETIYTQQQSRDLLTEIRRLASQSSAPGPINIVLQVGNKTVRSLTVDAINQDTMANGVTMVKI